MDIKLTREQISDCLRAIDDMADKGFTERTCPLCGQKLHAEVAGNSGEVWCETPGCFGKLTLRGI